MEKQKADRMLILVCFLFFGGIGHATFIKEQNGYLVSHEICNSFTRLPVHLQLDSSGVMGIYNGLDFF